MTAPRPTVRLTIEQAAARVGRSPETIRRWIRQGRLTVIDIRDVPADGLPEVERDARRANRWVNADDLLEVERMARLAKRSTTRGGVDLRYRTRQKAS